MRDFTDQQGAVWTATAIEEDTPRHHGRWYLEFHPVDAEVPRLSAPEWRWQSRPEARRTLATMSLFELRRKLAAARRRAGLPTPAGAAGAPWIHDAIDGG